MQNLKRKPKMSLDPRYRNLHRRRPCLTGADPPALRLRASLRAETGSRSAIALSPVDVNNNVRRSWSAVPWWPAMKAGSVNGRMPDCVSESWMMNVNEPLNVAVNKNVSMKEAVSRTVTVTVTAAQREDHRPSETVTGTVPRTVPKTGTVTVDEKANETVIQTEVIRGTDLWGGTKCDVLANAEPTAAPAPGHHQGRRRLR